MLRESRSTRSPEIDALARRLGLAARDPDDADPAVVLAWVEQLLGKAPAREVLDGSSTAQ